MAKSPPQNRAYYNMRKLNCQETLKFFSNNFANTATKYSIRKENPSVLQIFWTCSLVKRMKMQKSEFPQYRESLKLSSFIRCFLLFYMEIPPIS